MNQINHFKTDLRAIKWTSRVLCPDHQKNAKESRGRGSDPYLALLEYQNTPIAGLEYAPSQMLNSRLLRAKLPVKPSHLDPKVVDAHARLLKRQQEQKLYYDRHSTPVPYPQLRADDTVRVQRGKVWEPAVVMTSDSSPRSYIVRGENGSLRRNRRHLIKTTETRPLLLPPELNVPAQLINKPVTVVPATPAIETASNNDPAVVPAAASPSNVQQTRRGRVVRRPLRYQD